MLVQRAPGLWAAVLLALSLGAVRGESVPVPQPRQAPLAAVATAPAPESGATAAVAAAEQALSDRKPEALTAPFGGHIPGWARDWVTRRGKADLFDRQWHARAVRLPAPYHGAEWLAVFSMYHPVEADADHFHLLASAHGEWAVSAEIDEREPATEYRILHHEAELQLLPEAHRLQALDRMTVRRLVGARGLMLARMNDDYSVEAVRAAGNAVPFARSGGLLAVAMPPGPPSELPVEVRYSGEVRHPGMDEIEPDGAFLFSYWYPNIARLPATGDLTVTAPAKWTVIAQGERESRQEAGAVARTRWRQTHPVCWLQVAAGGYHQTARTVGTKTLNVYLLQPDEDRASKVLGTLEQALPFYSRTFGEYPWSHYDVVEYPLAVGALEGYTMTAMSPELFRNAIPHELSHSWWGGIVPNTYTVDMWNEGFASYSERLLNEASKPELPRGLRAGEERSSRWKLPPGLPILGAGDALDHPQSLVGYRKGAAVLHMFRRTVGDETFLKTLARFVTERSGQTTTWRDFQHVAEHVVGHEQRSFFDPWLTRDDVPRLRWISARQAGGTLDATLEMTNPGYHLRLPIAIDTEDGQRRVDTVEVSSVRTRFRRSVTGRVKRLVLDPAGDFMLQAADSGSHPWSVDVLASPKRAALPPGVKIRKEQPCAAPNPPVRTDAPSL
jgi:hypothetical protein